jgi:hypothetical protein
VAQVAFIPGYSGGTATDFHRLPLWHIGHPYLIEKKYTKILDGLSRKKFYCIVGLLGKGFKPSSLEGDIGLKPL